VLQSGGGKKNDRPSYQKKLQLNPQCVPEPGKKGPREPSKKGGVTFIPGGGEGKKETTRTGDFHRKTGKRRTFRLLSERRERGTAARLREKKGAWLERGAVDLRAWGWGERKKSQDGKTPAKMEKKKKEKNPAPSQQKVPLPGGEKEKKDIHQPTGSSLSHVTSRGEPSESKERSSIIGEEITDEKKTEACTELVRIKEAYAKEKRKKNSARKDTPDGEKGEVFLNPTAKGGKGGGEGPYPRR